jgi:hypothetical protein
VSLCRFHHRQVHEGRVNVLVLDDGAIRFVTPEGRSFESTLRDHTQPLGDWHQLAVTHVQQGVHIDHHTAATRWDGGACDFSVAVGIPAESLGARSRAVRPMPFAARTGMRPGASHAVALFVRILSALDIAGAAL